MFRTVNLEIGPEWQGPLQPVGTDSASKPAYLQVATEGATIWVVDAEEMPDQEFVGWMVSEGEGIVDLARFTSAEVTETYCYMRSSAQPGKTVKAVVGCFEYL